jgi:hypothetical protein
MSQIEYGIVIESNSMEAKVSKILSTVSPNKVMSNKRVTSFMWPGGNVSQSEIGN